MEMQSEIHAQMQVEPATFPSAIIFEKAREGFRTAYGHHGEIIQGALRSSYKDIQRFLVTLPCNKLMSNAKFIPNFNNNSGITAPEGKVKSIKAAEITLRHINCQGLSGHIELESNIEEGYGLGSSTTDVVATIRAVANAFGCNLAPDVQARLAVKAETASDAIMFDNSCVMFAQRRGVVLENLGRHLPALHVLSVNTARNLPVDTLTTPVAHYSDWELQSFCTLSGMIRRAIRTGDPYLLGRVASASSAISQRHLPKPAFAEINNIAKVNGACGVQVSHSGTVVGLLFDANCPALNTRLNAATKDLLAIGMPPAFSFSTMQPRLNHAL